MKTSRKWYNDFMKTIYDVRAKILGFCQNFWGTAPEEYQFTKIQIKQLFLVCGDFVLIFAFFFYAKFKVSNIIMAFFLDTKFLYPLCLSLFSVYNYFCKKSPILVVSGIADLWNHTVLTNFRDVFRTKSNIYDGAFLEI